MAHDNARRISYVVVFPQPDRVFVDPASKFTSSSSSSYNTLESVLEPLDGLRLLDLV